MSQTTPCSLYQRKYIYHNKKMPSCILFCFVQTCSCFSRSFKGNIYLELSRFAQDDRNLVEHQLWTHSSLTQYHSSLLLRVSKLRNSFFQVTWSHRNSCAKNDYLVNIGVAIHQYSLQLSCVLWRFMMFECHFDNRPSSKIMFAEPYKEALLELSMLCVGGETPSSHFPHHAILLIVWVPYSFK